MSNRSNSLFDLESIARARFGGLLKLCLEESFNIKLTQTDYENGILKRMSRPSHQRGEISVPCFAFAK